MGIDPEQAPKPFVLDDDPTGTQSVHGVPVLTRWDTDALENELRDPSPACFLLTNSRALPEAEAVRIARETGEMLARASSNTGIPFTVVSRSDSTLRGHFPAEVDALAQRLNTRLPADA
ncbi:MAG: four-carbon acid sugar kinase family protein, partial [Armatimonadaceae bacterium]